MRKLLLLTSIWLVFVGCTRSSRFHDDELDGDAATGDHDSLVTPELDGFVLDDTQEWDLPEGVECPEGGLRCSADGTAVQRCEEGSWAQVLSCSDGCAAAACLVVQSNSSCAEPLPLVVGQKANASTNGGEAEHVWPSKCTTAHGSAPVGAEMIHRLDITKAGAYRFELDALEPTSLAVYLRTQCDDPSTAWSSYCSAMASAGGSVTLDTLLAAGQYYVFVDDMGSSSGRYELTVSSSPTPICLEQRPTVLDLSSGSATVEGDTANGLSKTRWNQFQCGAPYDTTGKELIYALMVYEAMNVRVEALALSPADSRMGIYIRSDCVRTDSQLACAYSDGSAPPFFEQRLEPGVYYLFVDDFSTSLDKAQSFRLTVTVL